MTTAIQAKKLKRWATVEFHRARYNLPSEEHFRLLCGGPWKAVWMYLVDHVFQKRNVKIIRGNLRLQQVQQSKEAQKKLANHQQVSVKRRELRKKIELLKNEITLLDSKIQQQEQLVAKQVQKCQRTTAKVKDCDVKAMLLKAFWLHCYSNHNMLTDTTQLIREECIALQLIKQCMSNEVLFDLELSGHENMDFEGSKLAMEPIVLREARKLFSSFPRNSKQGFLEITIATPKTIHLQQIDAHNKWLANVQNLWSEYPVLHVLMALRQLLSRNKLNLKQEKTCLDKKRSTVQKPRVKGDHRLDVSTTKKKGRPSVKRRLKIAWKQVESKWVALSKTRSRVQRLRNQYESYAKEAQKASNNDSSTLLTLSKRLHCLMNAKIGDHLQKYCIRLKQTSDCAEKRRLREKRHDVVTFRKQLVDKQNDIKDQRKKILMAGKRIACLHAKLRELIHKRLLLLLKDIVTAATSLENSIFMEAKQLRRVPLDSLDRRNVEGEQRISASQLSIHHLQSRPSCHLSLELKSPHCVVPAALWTRSCARQHEIRHLHWTVQRFSANLLQTLEKAKWQSPSDEQDFLSEVQDKDSKKLKPVLRRARSLVSIHDAIFSLHRSVKSAIIVWQDQPAQYANPRRIQRELTYWQWKQRWNLAVVQL